MAKTIKQLQPHKFSAGDTVKVVRAGRTEWCKIGDTHTIRICKHDHKGEPVYVVDFDKDDSWIRECNLEIVERDRQKGGEWRRHRGGKIPECARGKFVEVRLRDCDNQTANADALIWQHKNCDESVNIMAYRVLEKPEQEEKEVEFTDHKFKVGDKVKVIAKDEGEWCQIGNIHTVRVLKESHEYGPVYVVDQDNECAWIRECNLELVESSVSVGTITYTVDLNTGPAIQKIEYLQAKWDQFDGPLKWRDHIIELEAHAEDIEREIASLFVKLSAEGFQLIRQYPMANEAEVAQVDMQDWRNWKVGDIVQCVTTPDSHGGYYTKCSEYSIAEVDLSDDMYPVDVTCDSGFSLWCPSHSFKFIRRP